jgi:hypothetical protein
MNTRRFLSVLGATLDGHHMYFRIAWVATGPVWAAVPQP